MFDIPDAKRVRREELYDGERSEGEDGEDAPDPELEKKLHERLAALYGNDIEIITSQAPATLTSSLDRASVHSEDEDDEPQEFEFRLFSNAKSEGAPAQKIVLEIEKEKTGPGDFVVKHRKREYYFSEDATGASRLGFESVAISGTDVLKGRDLRAWGLKVPWRVKVIKVVGKRKAGKDQGLDITSEKADLGNEIVKKKKPGKKRRILLRIRERKRIEAEEKRKRDDALKEETEKDKRTRRNREKKIKKKLKEKAEKAEKAKTIANETKFAETGSMANVARKSVHTETPLA